MTEQPGSFIKAPVITWLLLSVVFIFYLYNTFQLRSDVSFFLPEQHSLIDTVMSKQLREGEPGKLIIIALSLSNAEQSDSAEQKTAQKKLAQLNRLLAQKLHQSQRFSLVQNGQQDQSLLLPEPYYHYRYLLSRNNQQFSSEQLTKTFEQLLQRLELILSPVEQKLFSEDPVMSWFNLLKQWQAQKLKKIHGVWFDQNGQQSLLFVKTRAKAYDLSQQKINIDTIQSIFSNDPELSSINRIITGSPIFALESKKAISKQIQLISFVASLLLITFLFWFYRSVHIVLLASLPLAFAILTGVTAVIAIDGFIHGITLAFGITIIGVAVDYPIHFYSHQLFYQSRQAEHNSSNVISLIWPMMRLGLLTTIVGFSALLLSDFSGLKQLGLFAISGLLAAALMTRFVLPQFHTSNLTKAQSANPVPYKTINQFNNWNPPDSLRLIAITIPLLALCIILFNQQRLWQNDLAALSPVPEAQKQLDFKLRRDMGLPELRYAFILQAGEAEQLLQQAEQLGPVLDHLVQQGIISGFELISHYLPSVKQQRLRQQQLPLATELEQRLQQILAQTPLDNSAFTPFIQAISRSHQLTPLRPETLTDSYDKSNDFISAKIDSLLYPPDEYLSQWTAIIPLQGVQSELSDHAIMAQLPDHVYLLDLKRQTETMLAEYRHNALFWFAFGSLLILLILFINTRKLAALLRLFWPFTGAVLLTVATLLITGHSLSIFHLVTLLLVVGLGIDYSIFTFFSHKAQQTTGLSAEVSRVSVIICLISTIIMFAALAQSELPVLKAIGLTASLGAFYAFCLTWFINKPAKSVRPEQHRQ